MRWGIAVKAWFDIEGRAKNMPLKDVLEQPKGTRAAFVASQFPDRASTDDSPDINEAWNKYQAIESSVYSLVYDQLVIWPGVLNCSRIYNVISTTSLDTTRDGHLLFTELMAPSSYDAERQQDAISVQLSGLSEFASDPKSTRSPFRTSLDSVNAYTLCDFLEKWFATWALKRPNSIDHPRELILLMLKLLARPDFDNGPLRTWADATALTYKRVPSTYTTMRKFLDDARDVIRGNLDVDAVHMAPIMFYNPGGDGALCAACAPDDEIDDEASLAAMNGPSRLGARGTAPSRAPGACPSSRPPRHALPRAGARPTPGAPTSAH